MAALRNEGGSRDQDGRMVPLQNSLAVGGLFLAGPAGHGKGELHRIEGNTLPPRRVNGHDVPMGQPQCPMALSRTTTGAFCQHIEDVRAYK